VAVGRGRLSQVCCLNPRRLSSVVDSLTFLWNAGRMLKPQSSIEFPSDLETPLTREFMDKQVKFNYLVDFVE
jgi:hypothetical protein